MLACGSDLQGDGGAQKSKQFWRLRICGKSHGK